MGALILAWLIGEGIITWRAAATQHRPPVPGQLLAATGLFAGLAVAAQYPPARTVATVFAYGVDIAVLLQVLPGTAAAKPAAATTTTTAGVKTA
jgi:hypothetical protein